MRWLSVLGLLCLTYRSYSRAKHSLPKIWPDIMITLGVQEIKMVKSLGYPECCQSGNYRINLVNTNNSGHIRMVFLDLDIPPQSTLQIHDGNSCSSPLYELQPTFLQTAWTRPIIESSGTSLFINFTAGQIGSKHYLGFKASCWSVPAKGWKEDKPFTDCPLVGDPMDGGLMSLGQVLQPGDQIQYMFDCIWQLKPPSAVKDLTVYVHITTMDLNGGGEVVIIEDIMSEGRKIKHFMNTASSQNSATVFTSSKGFYIRLKKPLNVGHFEFIYGVYKDISSVNNVCRIEFDGGSEEGFKCIDEYNWCIPMEHACNSLQNCPGGDDEDKYLCTLTRSDLAVDSNLVGLTVLQGTNATNATTGIDSRMCDRTCPDGSCVPAWELCPGECFHFEKKCPDGRCVNRVLEKCQGECRRYEKQCTDGKCVVFWNKCPQEPCPTYKPFRCSSGKCIYKRDVCDRSNDCIGGEDEEDCVPYVKTEVNWSTVFLVFVAIPLIILCTICKVARKNRRDHIRDQQNRQRNNFNTSYRHRQMIRGEIPVIRTAARTIRTSAVRPFAHQTSRQIHMQVHTNSQRIPLMATLISRRVVETGQTEETAAVAACMIDAPPSYDEVMASSSYISPPPQELPSYSSVCHIQPEVV